MQKPFNQQLLPLVEAGLELPQPMQSALEGMFMPLAVSTRELLPAWCAAHGYTDDQVTVLSKAIRALTGHGS